MTLLITIIHHIINWLRGACLSRNMFYVNFQNHGGAGDPGTGGKWSETFSMAGSPRSTFGTLIRSTDTSVMAIGSDRAQRPASQRKAREKRTATKTCPGGWPPDALRRVLSSPLSVANRQKRKYATKKQVVFSGWLCSL